MNLLINYLKYIEICFKYRRLMFFETYFARLNRIRQLDFTILFANL